MNIGEKFFLFFLSFFSHVNSLLFHYSFSRIKHNFSPLAAEYHKILTQLDQLERDLATNMLSHLDSKVASQLTIGAPVGPIIAELKAAREKVEKSEVHLTKFATLAAERLAPPKK